MDVVALAYMRYLVTICVVDMVAVTVTVVVSDDQSPPPGPPASTDGVVSASKAVAKAVVKRIFDSTRQRGYKRLRFGIYGPLR